MKLTNSDLPLTPPHRNWSNRILAASLFGILFFTLFPYWVDFTTKHAPSRSLFLLGGPLKFDGILHNFLNALLFAPFGFALSRYFTDRRKSPLQTLVIAVVAGAVLSYSIEIIQLYMPSRDSAWDDVLANTFGVFIGAIFGLLCGGIIFRTLSKWEGRLERYLTARKLAIAAAFYFCLWLVASIPLQQKTHLNNWDPNSYLVVGHDVENSTHWSGKVLRIHLWDHALSADRAIELSKNSVLRDQIGAKPNPNLLASFDLSGAPPVRSKAGSIPRLTLRTFTNALQGARPPVLSDMTSSLISDASVPQFSVDVSHSNQIAILVDCVAARNDDRDGAIVGIANLSGESDLLLWQDHSSLVVMLRNGLDSRKAQLDWRVPRVFTAGASRSIVFSYNGAQGLVYVDGKKERQSYDFTPGAALIGTLIRVKADELVAYAGLFYSLVFLPLGFILGLAVRIMPRWKPIERVCICIAIVLSAITLEFVLARVSGRNASLTQPIVSIGLIVAGMLWMNLDPPASV
jgi:glycopeptide antibiotics resistance protein